MILWALATLRFFLPLEGVRLLEESALPPMRLRYTLGAFLTLLISYVVIIPFTWTYFASAKEMYALAVLTTFFFTYCFLIREQLFAYVSKGGFLKGVASWFIVFPWIFLWSSAMGFIFEKLLGMPLPEQEAVVILRAGLHTPWGWALLIFYIGLIVPAIEETLFRGFLQNWLKTMLGLRGATLFTAIIFACFHYAPSQGLSNITILSSLFLLACFLSWLLEKTESLLAPIGLHAMFNTMSMIFIFLKEIEP